MREEIVVERWKIVDFVEVMEVVLWVFQDFLV
jgi:hypothetical protein